MFSPFLRVPIPQEGQTPWYQIFLNMIYAFDAALYANMEDRNTILTGGGGFSFIADILSWESAFYIDSGGVTGFRCRIDAGSVTVYDNYYLYADVTRGMMEEGVGTVAAIARLGRSNNRIMIGQRRGNRFYFRNGFPLWQGMADVHILEDGPILNILAHGSTHVSTGLDPIPGIETQEGLYGCTVVELVLDAVYASGADAVRRADCASMASMPVVGFVISKPTGTTAWVLSEGDLDGFVGLTPGAFYYAAATGGISAVAPVVPGQIHQKLGWAKNTTTLHVEIEDPITVA